MPSAGRPTKYNQKVSNEICQRISDGESLEQICKDNHMPNTSNVRVWKNKHEEFQANYGRAREAQGDHYGQKVQTTAKDCISGIIPPDVARVAIDAFKWTAARMNRATYGDKTVTENHNYNRDVPLDEKTDEELLAIASKDDE